MIHPDLTVTVDAKMVLRVLGENHDRHLKEHSRLLLAWTRKMRDLTAELNALLRKMPDFAGVRKQVRRLGRVEASRPEMQTDRYQEIIDMLEAHCKSPVGPGMVMGPVNIALTADHFKAYVKDDWDWKQSWVETSNTYMSDEGEQ